MNKIKENKKFSLFNLIRPYGKLIIPLIILAILSNALTLWIPKLLASGIDGFLSGLMINKIFWQFLIAGIIIFVLTYLQSITQTFASEKVARDLRNELSDKISTRTFAEMQEITPAKLLTNLTSDIDAIKTFVSQAIVTLVSSIFLILGASFLLIHTNWRLGLLVIMIIPIIGVTFMLVFKKVRPLFMKTREVIDWLNKVINESIIGAALIRILHSYKAEDDKFTDANKEARNIGLSIVKLFSTMIPVITFASNLAVLLVLILGGKFVISGSMTLGEFTAFNSYIVILIFPVIMLGFISNLIASAQASYDRVGGVLSRADADEDGIIIDKLKGNVQIKNVSLLFGERAVLKDISLDIKAGSKVAIIGPTAAGKTQLLNLLIGLVKPTKGEIKYDGHDIKEYKKENLYKQIGLVFQDSIIFNISLRQNIAFNTDVIEGDMKKAIDTAELHDFIDSLPQGLETVVSERGNDLSGGQKQRTTLARALSINPRVLFLDDFTARVDLPTEKKILNNISNNYPELTLISVTQKISSVENYDQIVVLMEGEVIGVGKHEELMKTSPEYVQIYNSQQSTNTYEL